MLRGSTLFRTWIGVKLLRDPTGINLTSTLDAAGNRLVLAEPYRAICTGFAKQTGIWNPENECTTIIWDSLNREQHRILANGGTISHTWDAAGRETLIDRNRTASGRRYSPTPIRTTDNRLTVLELDGTRATFSFDGCGQIIPRPAAAQWLMRAVTFGIKGNVAFNNTIPESLADVDAADQQTLITPGDWRATTRTYDPTGN